MNVKYFSDTDTAHIVFTDREVHENITETPVHGKGKAKHFPQRLKPKIFPKNFLIFSFTFSKTPFPFCFSYSCIGS